MAKVGLEFTVALINTLNWLSPSFLVVSWSYPTQILSLDNGIGDIELKKILYCKGGSTLQSTLNKVTAETGILISFVARVC